MISMILTLILTVQVFFCAVFSYEEALGQAEAEFTAEGDLPATCAESSLGDLAADAVLDVIGTDFVLIPASAVSGTLEAGSVFYSDLERVIPEDQELYMISVSPVQLAEILEYGVSFLVTNEAEQIDAEASAWEGFPQISGFTWTYDVSALPGERIVRVKVNDEEIDLTDEETVYTMAVTASFLDEELGYPQAQEASFTGVTLLEAMTQYCTSYTLTEISDRSNPIGTSSYTLIQKIPIAAVVFICLGLGFFGYLSTSKHDKYFSFKGGDVFEDS